METTLDSTSAFQLSSGAARSTHRARGVGRVLTALPALFLTVDGAFKVVSHPKVLEACEQLGIPGATAPIIGVIALACVALHLIPRTAVLGAVLLTGYLGGAVFTHLRVGDPLFSHTLFPIFVGALIWGGLWLRDARARAFLTPR